MTNTATKIQILRDALTDICDPIAAMQRDLPEGYSLNGAMAVAMCDKPQHYQDIAAKALRLTEGAQDTPAAAPAQSVGDDAEIERCNRVIGRGDNVDHKQALDDLIAAQERIAARPSAAPSVSNDHDALRDQWLAVDREIGGKSMHALAFDDGVSVAAHSAAQVAVPECRACDANQAKIDALMLEYCPDEITPDQLAKWEASQRRATPEPAEPERCCNHDSDCAVHNAPALPVGPCDCSQAEPVSQPISDEAHNAAMSAFVKECAAEPVSHGEAANAVRDAAQELMDVLDEYHEQLVPINRKAVTCNALRNALAAKPTAVTAPDDIKTLFMDWWLSDMSNADFFNRAAPILGVTTADMDRPVPNGYGPAVTAPDMGARDAGIELAAKWHDERASCFTPESTSDRQHRYYARSIRALRSHPAQKGPAQ